MANARAARQYADATQKVHSTHLHQLPGVTLVEQIVDTVGVNANPPRRCAGSCHLVCDPLGVVTPFALRNGIHLVRVWGRLADCL